MGRYYRLSKEITEAEADEILRELREKEDLKSVELSEDLIALCFAVSVIPIVELIKLIQRAVSRGRA